MFTGLIQDVGRVERIERSGDDMRLRISTALDLSLEKLGASICCSGCCLTVVAMGGGWFDVDVSAETLSKTTLGDWKEDAAINLESSLRMGDELGGHFVFGHVDTVARIESMVQDGESWRIKIEPPQELMKFFAPKGSASINGVSLTVNDVDQTGFEVNIIPHTWEKTNLSTLSVGDAVNLEVDMLARYVERMMSAAA